MLLAYIECPTGIAGDMCLGALVHGGVPLDYLIDKLTHLGISDEYQLRAELVDRNGQQATKVHVDLSGSHHYHSDSDARSRGHHTHQHSHSIDSTFPQRAPAPHVPTRHLPEIEQMIYTAGLPTQAETWSLAVFRNLARAEGAVHGIPPEQVHFHEVGATDAIVDIVGTCLGLDWLGIEQLYCSALPTGGGTVRAAHGQLPVPVPAVLKLWEMHHVPVYSNGIQRELVTPTGAAIATTLATRFGPPPAMTIHRLGLGAGSHSLPLPNILRLWIGSFSNEQRVWSKPVDKNIEPPAVRSPQSPPIATGGFGGDPIATNADHTHEQQEQPDPNLETIAVLETQIDDLSPQAIAYLFEALFAAGAVDVFTQPIVMKKSRLGVLVTVISPPEKLSACEAILFRETTTLGIRRSLQQRAILRREIQSVETPYGKVRVKVAWTGNDISNVQPEYEDCAQLARENHLPWRAVHQLALQSWHQMKSPVTPPSRYPGSASCTTPG